MLTADDVVANPVLVRKIHRILAAENANIQDDSDDDDDDVRAPAAKRPGPEEISSSPVRTRTQQVKDERRSQAARNNREVSMVPNSQVQVLVREERGRPSSSAVTDVVDLEDEDGEEQSMEI